MALAIENTKMVDLYYIGGFTNPTAVVTSKGRAYHVPPAGESIRVPDSAARDIVRRNRDPQGNSVFTTDIRVVRAVQQLREQRENGQFADMMNEPTAKVVEKVVPAEQLSRDQLIALLAEMDMKEGN